MGICYQGNTLKKAISEKERLFKDTGYVYGLKKLELVESDPAKFMRFQMRLVAACISSRETAKMVSANPMSMIQGELLFMLANAEGDVASASYGLAGHFQSFPFILRSIAELGFEDDPGINPGDIFSTNDPFYGAPHQADCYTWVPVFYKGELVSWTVGMNHITDVGGLQPGSANQISPSVFTDGFTYPPTKTGANFKQHKWWELHWKRRTRTGNFNILDDKMRVAGAVTLHDRVLEIIEEFGVDYFRQGVKEIIERERRALVQRIKTQTIPGKYRYLHLTTARYKGVVGKLFPNSDKNWLIHEPAEFQIMPDARMLFDMEGLTSEDGFHLNTYEPTVRMATSIGAWPMIAYTTTINSSLMYLTEFNLPPGSMFNPQNPFAGVTSGLNDAAKYMNVFSNCLSHAFFCRGFLEECLPGGIGGVAYGLEGVMADGFRWAGGDAIGWTCSNSAATPYADGEPAMVCHPNPASDLGETEVSEFLQPTQLTLGKKLIPNYCAHGKYRAGLGMGVCQMVNEPGQYLAIAAFSACSGMGAFGIGMSGGYPGLNEAILFAHDTNIRQILAEGGRYPTDIVELRQWIDEGKLKAGRIETFKSSTPNIKCKDGDLFAFGWSPRNAWGDPLDREYRLVEDDVKNGWITEDVARGVYGVVVDDQGNVKSNESDQLRQDIRAQRKERSTEAKDWWKVEREKVVRKEWQTEVVYNLFADGLKYGKFRREFAGMWQLPESYSL